MKQNQRLEVPCQTNVFLLFCFVMITVLIGIGFNDGAEAADPQYGGIYRGCISEPGHLDPHIGHLPQAYAITGNIYNTLLRWKKDMSDVEPDLAESWTRTDDLTYVFKLRKGIKFHNIAPVNGRELTSADVKYSIERVSGLHGNKAIFTNRHFFEDQLTSIETPDKYTVIFKTKKPYAAFIPYLAYAKCAIVPRDAVEKLGDLKNKAIGTGPFILKEYVRGSHLTLEKNPDYFKEGLPYLDQVHLKIMSGAANIMSAFLAGQLDSFGPYFFQLKTLKKQEPDVKIISKEGTYLFHLRLSPWIEGKKPLKPPFDKLKVRQAITMAINKKELLNLAWGGFGAIQIGPIPNWPPYSLPEEDQIEYDPEKAKQLLAEAGYPNGFSTTLVTWNATYMQKPAVAIKEMLKKIGIDVELKFMEQAAYFNFIYRFDYDMCLHTSTMGVDPDQNLIPYFGPLEKSTYFKWSNPAIWKIIEEQSQIVGDKEKRAALVQKAQRMILADAPLVYLYTVTNFTAMKPYVHRDLYLNELQSLIAEEIWLEKH